MFPVPPVSWCQYNRLTEKSQRIGDINVEPLHEMPLNSDKANALCKGQLFLFAVFPKQIRDLRDGDKCIWIDLMDNGTQAHNLKSVNYKVDHCLFFAGEEAKGSYDGNTTTKGFRQFLADWLRITGDDGGGLCFIYAFNDKVRHLKSGYVGKNGVERKSPIPHK